jgi:hypothetical protein
MQSFLKVTTDNTYTGLVQHILIGLMELCFFLDLQKRKTVIAIIARLEGAEWYCYRNRQIFTYDETVSLKVTLLYLLIYTMVET